MPDTIKPQSPYHKNSKNHPHPKRARTGIEKGTMEFRNHAPKYQFFVPLETGKNEEQFRALEKIIMELYNERLDAFTEAGYDRNLPFKDGMGFPEMPKMQLLEDKALIEVAYPKDMVIYINHIKNTEGKFRPYINRQGPSHP